MLERDPIVAKKHQDDYQNRLLEMKRLIEVQADHYSNFVLAFEMIIPQPLNIGMIDNGNCSEIRPTETITIQLQSQLDQTIHSISFPNGRVISWQSFCFYVEYLPDLGDHLIQLEQTLCQYE